MSMNQHVQRVERDSGTTGGASLRAVVRDVNTVQGIFHSGVRNMFLTSAVAVALAAFTFSSKARKELRIGLAIVSLAIIGFSATYGMGVAKYHREASRMLGEGIDTDETVAPHHRKFMAPLARLLAMWEIRVKLYVVILVAIGLGILLACVMIE